MKKTLLFLSLIIFSCSTPEAREEQPTNCQCETILTATSFTLPNQTTQTVVTVENDCSGAQRQRTLTGLHSVGEKICN